MILYDYTELIHNMYQNAINLREAQAKERKQYNNQVDQHLSWADELIPAHWFNNMQEWALQSTKIVLYYR